MQSNDRPKTDSDQEAMDQLRKGASEAKEKLSRGRMEDEPPPPPTKPKKSSKRRVETK